MRPRGPAEQAGATADRSPGWLGRILVVLVLAAGVTRSLESATSRAFLAAGSVRRWSGRC